VFSFVSENELSKASKFKNEQTGSVSKDQTIKIDLDRSSRVD